MLPKAERQKLVASVVDAEAGRDAAGADRRARRRRAARSRRRPRRATSASSGSRRSATRSAACATSLPSRERRIDPRDTLDALLAQFGRRAVAAQNIVVIQAEIGSAPAIARALDRLEHPQVVGTLAGDDTCLVIAQDERRARALARELSASIGS